MVGRFDGRAQMALGRGGLAVAGALALAACGGTSNGSGGVAGGSQPNAGPDAGTATTTTIPDAGSPPVVLRPPISLDGWTFYGAEQGLPVEVFDVSADEGGNVYAAGGDGIYAKVASASRSPATDLFTRFDAASAGITKNCYQGLDPFRATSADLYRIDHPQPPGPPAMCPIISIAGASAGRLIVGFHGYGTDGDLDGEWAKDSGGLDVLRFDAAAGTLARTRHVHVATPPGVICGQHETSANPNVLGPCAGFDEFMLFGRRKLHKVYRLVVNHHQGTAQYGDVWMGGTHTTLAAFFNDQAEARGWYGNQWIRGCTTAPGADPSVCPKFSDLVNGSWNVFEHEHPAFNGTSFPGRPGVPMGPDRTGDTWAMAIAPDGQPWAHNSLRLASMNSNTADLSSVFMTYTRVFDLWPDTPNTPTTLPTDPNPGDDNVQSMTFCPDGALWVGSINHGLARVDTSTGAISSVGLPGGGQNVWAVACDRRSNLWISTDFAEIVRYDTTAGTFSMAPPTLPELARHVAWNIQIDEWSQPNPVVYFAMRSFTDKQGQLHPGGVVAFGGP
jgi:hypothetical protein